MSYVALATDQFEEHPQGRVDPDHFLVVDGWNRANARGSRLNLGGMRLEIFDNGRERTRLQLNAPGDRFHLVIEVNDINEAHDKISIEAPRPQATSWGAHVFQVHDPDGVPITFLQWSSALDEAREKIRGRLVSGIGRGKDFTQLDWARREFIDKLGFDPFPGTLNVILDNQQSLSTWGHLRATPGVRLENPNSGPGNCSARCFKVSIEGQVDAAIVLPEVESYPENQVEVIAPIELREWLAVKDGDLIILSIE